MGRDGEKQREEVTVTGREADFGGRGRQVVSGRGLVVASQ